MSGFLVHMWIFFSLEIQVKKVIVKKKKVWKSRTPFYPRSLGGGREEIWLQSKTQTHVYGSFCWKQDTGLGIFF